MKANITRRQVLVGGGLLTASVAFPSLAQSKPKLRFSAVFTEQDIRADMARMFADGIKDDFEFEGYYGGNLFKQGTELVAVQRGNLEMGNIAPQDVSKQAPEWSIVTSGYLFRDPKHVQAFFKSEASAGLMKLAEEKVGIKILGPTYYGVRQVGMKSEKTVNVPADLAGVKMRMPPGEAWQFLGAAMGANPTPMAFAEVYTGLQTGAIDAQDNPLPNVETMKFYEVMNQIVLTSHLIAFDLWSISAKVWRDMSTEKQARMQAAADKAIAYSTQKHMQREQELAEFFKSKGLKVYTPNVEAFRKHVQEKYLSSDLAKSWPAGLVDKINAL